MDVGGRWRIWPGGDHGGISAVESSSVVVSEGVVAGDDCAGESGWGIVVPCGRS